ncbi:MAG: hypothetical protein R2845_11425 [Thermomicrobiales bacterium]
MPEGTRCSFKGTGLRDHGVTGVAAAVGSDDEVALAGQGVSQFAFASSPHWPPMIIVAGIGVRFSPFDAKSVWWLVAARLCRAEMNRNDYNAKRRRRTDGFRLRAGAKIAKLFEELPLVVAQFRRECDRSRQQVATFVLLAPLRHSLAAQPEELARRGFRWNRQGYARPAGPGRRLPPRMAVYSGTENSVLRLSPSRSA